jgi:hypothetical protein
MKKDGALNKLIKRSRKIIMTRAEMDEQRLSFAYGNASMSNPLVTREMIRRAAEELRQKNPET